MENRLRTVRFLPVLASIVAFLASGASLAATCRQEAGAAKSAVYVKQCLEVSPATHPPCNASNPCALITDEIRRGCGLLDADAPEFCADYGTQ